MVDGSAEGSSDKESSKLSLAPSTLKMEVLLKDVSHSLYSSSSDRCRSSLLIDLLAARCDLAEACWSDSDFDPHQRFMKRFHGGDDGSCLEFLIVTLFYAALAASNVKKILVV